MSTVGVDYIHKHRIFLFQDRVRIQSLKIRSGRVQPGDAWDFLKGQGCDSLTKYSDCLGS